MTTQTITQSMLLTWLHCPRRAWLRSFRPHLALGLNLNDARVAATAELKRIAEFPYAGSAGGERMGRSAARAEPISCADVIASRNPLFRAAVRHDDVIVRADILAPAQAGWRLVTVKPSAGVKKHHLAECAVQTHVLEAAGFRIAEICLAHVNTAFEFAGNNDYDGLVLEEEVTATVRELLPDVPTWIASCQDTLSGSEPSPRMGAKCKSQACEYLDICSESLPAFPVSILPNGRKLVDELIDEGIEDVRDIPDSRLKTKKHIRIWDACRTGRAFVSPELGKTLAALPYPRFYLDFETMNLAMPRWIGVRPHQQVPFQWSCHIEQADGTLSHREFLETSGQNPIRAFAEGLLDAIQGRGPVIVYGRFEGQVLANVGAICPDLSESIVRLKARLVDIHPWLQEHYYHPDMQGSWSIKAVLPTVAPHLDYRDLEDVSNGAKAQAAYIDIIDNRCDPVVRESRIRNLLEYCRLDTLALVEVVRFFQRQSATGTRDTKLFAL